MEIALAYNLKSDYSEPPQAPEDWLEEYDEAFTIDAIENALRSNGWKTARFGAGREFLFRIQRKPVDLVFNIAEGRGSLARESHIPAICELAGVPYTFSSARTLALCLNKYHTKLVMKSSGIPVPKGFLCRGPALPAFLPVPFPLIAKPYAEGSSMGIRARSLCHSRKELEQEVARLWNDYRQPVLVEEFLPGREITVALLGNGENARVLGWMEIRPQKPSPSPFLYSLERKRNWRKEIHYDFSPSLTRREEQLLRKYALRAYNVAECRDAARLDFRFNSEGIPHLLEINPLAGLNPVHSDLPMIARSSGLDFTSFIGRIVDEALQRYSRTSAFALRNSL